MEIEIQPRATSRASTHGSDWTTDSDSEEITALIPQQESESVERPEPSRTISEGLPTCWICYDEDTSASASNWIKCQCTLIAHEACLLAWVKQFETNHSTPVACPACKDTYIIREAKSNSLLFLIYLEKLFRKLSVVMVMAGGTATVISGFGIYGRWCISQFAGESNLEKSKSGWLQRFNGLSPATIPVILILSRTTRLNSIFPFFPLLFLSDTLQLPTLTLECPPSLSLTVAMLPWLRLLYLRTKQEFYSRIGVEQPKWSQVFELDRLPVDEGPMAEDEPILRAEEILSLGRVASTLTTTLLFPLGARLVGNVLYALASRLKGSQITFLKPIHLRTCVGGTLLLFTRDAVELYRGLLRRRKMNSRKIISKGNRLNSIRD